MKELGETICFLWHAPCRRRAFFIRTTELPPLQPLTSFVQELTLDGANGRVALRLPIL